MKINIKIKLQLEILKRNTFNDMVPANKYPKSIQMSTYKKWYINKNKKYFKVKYRKRIGGGGIGEEILELGVKVAHS